jgi:hypothetical protein
MHPEHPQEIFPAELAIGEPTFIYEDLQAVCVFMPREVLQEEAVDSRTLLNFRWDQQRAGHFFSEVGVTRRKWGFPSGPFKSPSGPFKSFKIKTAKNLVLYLISV